MNIEILELKKRYESCLKRNGIMQIEDLENYSLYDISFFRDFGMGCLNNLISILEINNFDIRKVFKNDQYTEFIINNHIKYKNIIHMVSVAIMEVAGREGK